MSRHEIGRLSAKYVQRILTGVKPKDLPVEGVDKIDLIINLKTAKQIGLTIPQRVLGGRTRSSSNFGFPILDFRLKAGRTNR